LNPTQVIKIGLHNVIKKNLKSEVIKHKNRTGS